MPKGSPGKSRKRKLTPQQRIFVQASLAGDLPKVAYKKAYPSATKRALKGRPYVMNKNLRVKAAISAGLAGVAEKIAAQVGGKTGMELAAAGLISREVAEAGMTRVEKRKLLKKIANDSKASRVDRIRAIQTDNLMTGDNKPVRFEGEITLHGIFRALMATTALPGDHELIELNGMNGSNGHNGHGPNGNGLLHP